ncbi:hypothetical protein ACS0TY_000756 [Phlomoides rotata]
MDWAGRPESSDLQIRSFQIFSHIPHIFSPPQSVFQFISCKFRFPEKRDLNRCFDLCEKMRVIGELGISWGHPQTVMDLLQANLGGCFSKKCKVLWRIIVSVVCWSIWLERNNRL